MNGRAMRRKLAREFELLEPRRLMAVDLSVSQQVVVAGGPGEATELQVVVRNIGYETAVDAQILSDLEAILDNMTWSAESSFCTRFRCTSDAQHRAH